MYFTTAIWSINSLLEATREAIWLIALVAVILVHKGNKCTWLHWVRVKSTGWSYCFDWSNIFILEHNVLQSLTVISYFIMAIPISGKAILILKWSLLLSVFFLLVSASTDIVKLKPLHRADSRLVPSQWETSLQSNAISHWLGANLESALLQCPEWSHISAGGRPSGVNCEPATGNQTDIMVHPAQCGHRLVDIRVHVFLED